MKSKNYINKLLKDYVFVDRPSRRNRKYKGYTIFLISNYNMPIKIYAIDANNNILFKKEISNSWFDAFNYYYNGIEILLNGENIK